MGQTRNPLALSLNQNIVKEENVQVRSCTAAGSVDILTIVMISFFPVAASWQEWGQWGRCTVSCGKGGTRQRKRSFVPGRNGASAKPVQGQATQEESCKAQPSCPQSARLEPWGEWSPCTRTCYPQGGPMPQKERTKPCKEAAKSTDEKLNSGLLFCKDLKAVKEHNDCKVSACSGFVSK